MSTHPGVPPSAPKAIKAQLLITLDTEGNVSVEGTVSDQLFIFGLLELTKIAVREAFNKPKSTIIQPPPGFTPPRPNGP